MSPAARIVQFDWDAFHARVERLRVVHDARPGPDAVRRSLEAFTRWGVAPPSSFLQEHPEAVAAVRHSAH